MLTFLEIENFKGVAGRQRVDFSPLTLLFGANSAGKSTILQALLYLYEVVEGGSADVDRTELGGSVLELGGFARLVHRHETERSIVLRAEFATPGGLVRFGRDLTDFPFPDLDDEVESAWLELRIGFRTTAAFRGPLVELAIIGVNGDPEPVVWLETGSSLRDGEPLHVRVNLGHPILASDAGDQLALLTHAPADVTEAWEQLAIPEAVLQQENGELHDADSPDSMRRADGRSLPVFAIGRSSFSALPRLEESIRILPFNDLEADREQLAGLLRESTSEARSRARELSDSIDTQIRAAEQVRTFLEMVVIGTTSQLASFLRESIYVGPLRSIPPRGFLYERAGRITSWGDGLAAWDLLLSDRLNLIEDANKELRRLGGGCQVAAQQLVDTTADAEQVSANHPDKTARRLLLDTGSGTFVLPSEVGAGISQIIPVIVAALDRRSGLTLIEQPELHVHPAVQVGLGDLFIDSVMREGSRRMMLIETHSEHVILRLLRRIRETTEDELPDDALPFTEDKLSVLYVESTPDGVRVRRLRVDERGEFVDQWPKGFFEERAEELF